jgi:hypothetical protein
MDNIHGHSDLSATGTVITPVQFTLIDRPDQVPVAADRIDSFQQSVTQECVCGVVVAAVVNTKEPRTTPSPAHRDTSS